MSKKDSFGFGVVVGLVLMGTIMIIFMASGTQHTAACDIVEQEMILSFAYDAGEPDTNRWLLQADSIFRHIDSILESCYCDNLRDVIDKRRGVAP